MEAMGLEPTNLLTASQALYQLSYAPGQPGTIPVSTRRSLSASTGARAAVGTRSDAGPGGRFEGHTIGSSPPWSGRTEVRPKPLAGPLSGHGRVLDPIGTRSSAQLVRGGSRGSVESRHGAGL